MGESHEHDGQIGAAPVGAVPALATSVGKPPASLHSGGMVAPLPCQSASGPTQPPSGAGGAQV